MVIASKTLQDKLISGHVTRRNVWCNLCGNGVKKLRDKLQAELRSCNTASKLALSRAGFKRRDNPSMRRDQRVHFESVDQHQLVNIPINVIQQ